MNWSTTRAIDQLLNLLLGLLPSRESLHKISQASREGSLDRTIGDPHSLSKLLKVIGVQRLIQCSVGGDRKRYCRCVSPEQCLLH